MTIKSLKVEDEIIEYTHKEQIPSKSRIIGENKEYVFNLTRTTGEIQPISCIFDSNSGKVISLKKVGSEKDQKKPREKLYCCMSSKEDISGDCNICVWMENVDGKFRCNFKENYERLLEIAVKTWVRNGCVGNLRYYYGKKDVIEWNGSGWDFFWDLWKDAKSYLKKNGFGVFIEGKDRFNKYYIVYCETKNIKKWGKELFPELLPKCFLETTEEKKESEIN